MTYIGLRVGSHYHPRSLADVKQKMMYAEWRITCLNSSRASTRKCRVVHLQSASISCGFITASFCTETTTNRDYVDCMPTYFATYRLRLENTNLKNQLTLKRKLTIKDVPSYKKAKGVPKPMPKPKPMDEQGSSKALGIDLDGVWYMHMHVLYESYATISWCRTCIVWLPMWPYCEGNEVKYFVCFNQ